MLKVYSPDGVSWRLWNSRVSARGAEAITTALQRNQIVGFDIVTTIVRTFAVEIEIGWPVNAAELRFLGRLSRQRDDNHAGRNRTAFPMVPIIELAVDAATPHPQTIAGHDRPDKSVYHCQHLFARRTLPQ